MTRNPWDLWSSTHRVRIPTDGWLTWLFFAWLIGMTFFV